MRTNLLFMTLLFLPSICVAYEIDGFELTTAVDVANDTSTDQSGEELDGMSTDMPGEKSVEGSGDTSTDESIENSGDESMDIPGNDTSTELDPTLGGMSDEELDEMSFNETESILDEGLGDSVDENLVEELDIIDPYAIITRDSGLTIEPTNVIDDCEPKSKLGDFLTVQYVGSYTNGTALTPKHSLNLILGECPTTLISGWVEGLQGMCEGEARKLIIPPDLGYGNATLHFDMEILDVDPNPDAYKLKSVKGTFGCNN